MNKSKQRQTTHKARKRPTTEQKQQEALHKFRSTVTRRKLLPDFYLERPFRAYSGVVPFNTY
jgi:hypothetical protein